MQRDSEVMESDANESCREKEWKGRRAALVNAWMRVDQAGPDGRMWTKVRSADEQECGRAGRAMHQPEQAMPAQAASNSSPRYTVDY